jgi:undecaprenyl-diphosphatase
MPVYQAIVLAIVQGFTEFLPISSSAHLFLVPWLLGWPDQGLDFDIALHIGTLIAVLIYFARDWVQVAAQGFGLSWGTDPELKKCPRLLWYLAAASLPAGVIGLKYKDEIETSLRNPLVMGTMLILVGILLAIAEKISWREKHIGEVTLTDSLLIGTSQALALVPGTSRSGITISTGLFRGLTHSAAARFSFLLSTPIIAASGAKSLYDLTKHGIADGMLTPFLIGIAVSALTGLVVIAFFLRIIRSHGLRPFIVYRIVFGIVVVALAIVRSRG